MILSGAEIIIKYLEHAGVEIVTGIPGGANLPIYDSLSRSKIRHILARHEQGAGFIAHGMARSTGKTSVCLASSGPGATNLLTAIADAKLDSVPIIAITGQVPAKLLGTDAFQEVDTCGITRSITKHNYLVKSAEELVEILPQAFDLAISGRPGPVLIDIPKDVQLEKIEFEGWTENKMRKNLPPIPSIRIKKIAEMIHNSNRPVLYIGGGIVNSGSSELVKELSHKNSIPVALSLMGLGAFPSSDPLCLGMLGMHAARYTNHMLDEADLILAFGVRFDDRATGNVNEFCKYARIVHIDIDRAEINKIKSTALPLVGNIHYVLKELNQIINKDNRTGWLSRIKELKVKYSVVKPDKGDLCNPAYLIMRIGELADKDAIITTDVGQHQMWVAQVYPFEYPRSLITSGGLGTMGFGLPAAIGVALANPGKCVINISGDGSVFMNIQELATLAELNLNVKIIIFNNRHLGLVRQQQEMFYNNNIYASRFESDVDFTEIGRAFGIKSYNLGDEDTQKNLSGLLSGHGPVLINAPVLFSENVLPIVPPGMANRDMIIDEKSM
ncbi:MAG: biosynthetic-type acetolactate synthase large subunit [Spirochaetota bacterium]